MIRRARKPNPNFNMSSMTDIVFLLLIFFMVTSTLINPNALRLLLPKSTNQTSNQPTAVVSIDRNLTFYFNQKVVPFSQLESRIVDALKNADDPCVEQAIKIMNEGKAFPQAPEKDTKKGNADKKRTAQNHLRSKALVPRKNIA